MYGPIQILVFNNVLWTEPGESDTVGSLDSRRIKMTHMTLYTKNTLCIFPPLRRTPKAIFPPTRLPRLSTSSPSSSALSNPVDSNAMKGGTLQINWHDTKPVLALDFHSPAGLLATGGSDHDIKVF